MWYDLNIYFFADYFSFTIQGVLSKARKLFGTRILSLCIKIDLRIIYLYKGLFSRKGKKQCDVTSGVTKIIEKRKEIV